MVPIRSIEIQALAGDSSDNVPGVPGIGEKTAKALIDEFGDIETLLASLDQLKGKRRENLENFCRPGPFVEAVGDLGY